VGNGKWENVDACASALHGFAASPIAFISHEYKQVVIQFLIKPLLIILLPIGLYILSRSKMYCV